MTTIFEALGRGDAEAVRAVLADDPSAASARDESGRSAVRAALYAQRRDLADIVLEAGPTLDVFDAAAVGDAERLAELLEADPSLTETRAEDGFSPLHMAAYFGCGDAARLLLDRGADVGAVSDNDLAVQPLHSAVAGGHRDVAAALLVAGADPSARQRDGLTPLMAAEQSGDVDLARLLTDHGAEEAATAPG